MRTILVVKQLNLIRKQVNQCSIAPTYQHLFAEAEKLQHLAFDLKDIAHQEQSQKVTRKPRICYYTNEAFEIDDRHLGRAFRVAKVTENERGYEVAGVFNTLQSAREYMQIRNSSLNLSPNDILDIVASSMLSLKK